MELDVSKIEVTMFVHPRGPNQLNNRYSSKRSSSGRSASTIVYDIKVTEQRQRIMCSKQARLLHVCAK